MQITITFEHHSTKLGHAIRMKRGMVPLRTAAVTADIPWPTLARLESGKGMPDRHNFLKLAKWLGLKKSEYEEYASTTKF